MRIACWIPKATNAHSEYLIIIVFPLQPRLQEGASALRYTSVVLVGKQNDNKLLRPCNETIKQCK